MSTSNFNMEDPAKQEAIRRGTHEYVAGEGRHGHYVPRAFKHQEYPKMMGKWPVPQIKDFRQVNGVIVSGDMALANFQIAMQEWDRAMTASIVNNKAEESAWLKENG